jgi:hypothetical protein
VYAVLFLGATFESMKIYFPLKNHERYPQSLKFVGRRGKVICAETEGK